MYIKFYPGNPMGKPTLNLGDLFFLEGKYRGVIYTPRLHCCSLTNTKIAYGHGSKTPSLFVDKLLHSLIHQSSMGCPLWALLSTIVLCFLFSSLSPKLKVIFNPNLKYLIGFLEGEPSDWFISSSNGKLDFSHFAKNFNAKFYKRGIWWGSISDILSKFFFH